MPNLALTATDFFDKGHLNRRGAAKFSSYFTEILGEKLGITPDLHRAFAYTDEFIIPMENGLYQYSMQAIGKEILFRFEVKEGDRLRLIQDWSSSDTVLFSLPPEKADEMVVSMCPTSMWESRDKEGLTLSFMTQNKHILNAQ